MKINLKQEINRLVENLTSTRNLIYICIVLYFLLMVTHKQLSLFWWPTVILMHALPGLVTFVLLSKAQTLQSQGIINLLPKPIQNLLLKNSVFDLLCKVWFPTKASLYIKRLALPFFVKMERNEALRMFEELNPEVAQKLSTPGVLNVLPPSVSEFLLPKVEYDASTAASESGHEEIKTMTFDHDQNIVKLKTHRTQLLSSSKVDNKRPTSDLDSKIQKITEQIPTLEPVFSQILGNKFRQLMTFISYKALGFVSVGTGVAIVAQLVFSKHARRWAASGAKLGLFLGAIVLLLGSISGMCIKFVHNRVQEPKKLQSPSLSFVKRQLLPRKRKLPKVKQETEFDFFNPDLAF